MLIIPGLEVKIGTETNTIFGGIIAVDPMGGIPPEPESTIPETEEVTEPTPDTTVAPAETTDAPAENTDVPTATVTAPTESGCKSMLGSMAFLLMAGMAVVVTKKKGE